ncbi:hypothetical protein KQ944_08405 [Bacillus subtilis]|uniref:bestrophin-like domain n=1 Tax=Pseudochrobactrum asaccharolyticum TaxID=354351 RepID=UPI001F38D19F|nr:hypothetical protein [Pseudochrobactrum asaccharolyticum]MCF7644928.1 hypothetical protein [Pseudochrobactrum asaccharolyticum]MCF7671644.1 hypothetical protein [Bacillus subtilis]
MHYLFGIPPILMFLLFTICGIVFYIVGLVFLKVFGKQASKDILSLPIGAFIGTIATAWALALGFVAADTWAVNSRADQAASEERSSITRLIGMARPEALNDPLLLKALTTYRVSVITDEWHKGYNNQPARAVEESLQNIRIAMIALSRTDISGALMSQMVQDFDEMQDARNKRLALGSSSVNHYKWYLVFFLTVLSLVVITAVHADRPKAGRKALGIYIVTAVMSMWILAIHASPYRGAGRIEPSVLFTSQKGTQSLPEAFYKKDPS